MKDIKKAIVTLGANFKETPRSLKKENLKD